MGKDINLDSPLHDIKAVIHEGKDFIIVVRSIQYKEGPWSRNTLVKIQLKPEKDGNRTGRQRGFNLDDMLILKKNWGRILKELTNSNGK